jgi:hypothetical protein
MAGQEQEQQEEPGTQIVTKNKSEIMDKLARSNFVVCPESSEVLASIAHLMLAISL